MNKESREANSWLGDPMKSRIFSTIAQYNMYFIRTLCKKALFSSIINYIRYWFTILQGREKRVSKNSGKCEL